MNIALDMMLREVCGSDVRYRVLRALYEQPDRELPLRRLAYVAQVDPGNASKLLKRLVMTGLCERIEGGPNPKFRAHRDNPLLEPLKNLFVSAGALASKPLEKIASSQRYGDQEQREINEAVALNKMPAKLRGRVLAQQFERLQSRANDILGAEPVEPGVFYFKSQTEKNKRDDDLEIERAVRRARATA